MDDREQARELALQVLFTFDAQQKASQDQAVEVVDGVESSASVRARAIEMALAAWEARKTSDDWVQKYALKWPTHRQPAVDRALLRLAVWELTSEPTPARVVIDQAVELAKRFSTAQSPGFVNGILDSIRKEVEALKSV